MKTRKERFVEMYKYLIKCEFDIDYLVIAVSIYGKTELIINQSKSIPDKMKYYTEAYNDDLSLKSNPEIKMINWMFA